VVRGRASTLCCAVCAVYHTALALAVHGQAICSCSGSKQLELSGVIPLHSLKQHGLLCPPQPEVPRCYDRLRVVRGARAGE
jgi:hypothetical protein